MTAKERFGRLRRLRAHDTRAAERRLVDVRLRARMTADEADRKRSTYDRDFESFCHDRADAASWLAGRARLEAAFAEARRTEMTAAALERQRLALLVALVAARIEEEKLAHLQRRSSSDEAHRASHDEAKRLDEIGQRKGARR